jgi:CubicO group peptidase (beta-lactamase class C family)
MAHAGRVGAEATRAVDGLVARAQADGRVPTLVAAVVRDGSLAHLARSGTGPADPHVQYRIGSITKTMTAVLVLQLRDAGRLALDDPLDRHLPGTPVGQVTLRQLLGHVSGLRREPAGSWWERAPGRDLAALLDGIGPDALTHPPYRRFHYSNLAYGLLGAVVHRATGEQWRALVDRWLLGPLGMRRTTYLPEQPYARGYVVHPWHGTLREEPRHDSLAMAPAGQLWSTPADLARWAGFLADPDPAVLAPATMAEMCVPVAIRDPDQWASGYGLGVELWRVGERIYAGHAGSMPGYCAVVMVHRPSRTAVAAVTDAYALRGGGIGQVGRQLLTAVLDLDPVRPPQWSPTAPGEAPPEPVAPLCGRWWWMGLEYEAAWDPASSELVLTPLTRLTSSPPASPARAYPASRFTQDGADRWRGTAGPDDGEELLVRRDGTGGVSALDIATFVYTRDPDVVG